MVVLQPQSFSLPLAGSNATGECGTAQQSISIVYSTSQKNVTLTDVNVTLIFTMDGDGKLYQMSSFLVKATINGSHANGSLKDFSTHQMSLFTNFLCSCILKCVTGFTDSC